MVKKSAFILNGLMPLWKSGGLNSKFILPKIEFGIEAVRRIFLIRHVGQQKLKDHFLGVSGLSLITGHFHTIGGITATGRCKCPFTINFHHTGPAVPIGPNAFLVTETGDFYTNPVCSLKDGFPF